jgi:hypothetical protein
VPGEFARDYVAVARKHDLNLKVARREHGAFDNRLGGEITPHRVERDFHDWASATYSLAVASSRPR